MNSGFSVLMPVYNRAAHVSQAIESLLSQISSNDEVFVIDDGSTDATPQILESYGSRIHAIRQSNQGPEVARNRAAALAQREYLLMLDSDDVLLPGALAIYRRIIAAFDSPPLILGSMTYFLDGHPLPVNPAPPGPIEVLKFRDYLSKDIPVAMSNSRIVIRRSVFEEIGRYRQTSPTTFLSDDFDLVLRAATQQPFILVQKPFTVAYRKHPAGGHLNAPELVNGILGMVRSERSGRYPGGKRRRWARYAFIGGISSSVAVRHCWKRGFRGQAIRLLAGTAPMVLVAAADKFLRQFRKATPATVLPLSPTDVSTPTVAA